MANWTSASFNSNVLQTTNILLSVIDHYSAPSIDAPFYKIAHANKSVQPTFNWQSKTIVLKGSIISTTSIADLDSRLDTFKSWFTSGGNLDIDYNSGTRRYVCGVPDVQISRDDGLTHATFTITFTALTFGQDISATTALNATGRTNQSYTDTVTFGGSAPFQLPVITITYTALTASGNQTVSWGNNANGQTISVTRGWSVNDVLVIDCNIPTNPVTVNGIAVDFSGAFPEFAPGSQSFTYADQFSAKTFNEVVSYYALYM